MLKEFPARVRAAISERSGNRCECARKRCTHNQDKTDGTPATLQPKAYGDGLRCTGRFQEAHHLDSNPEFARLHTFNGKSNGQALCAECHARSR